MLQAFTRRRTWKMWRQHARETVRRKAFHQQRQTFSLSISFESRGTSTWLSSCPHWATSSPPDSECSRHWSTARQSIGSRNGLKRRSLMSVEDNSLMMSNNLEFKAESPNWLRCSSPFTSQFNAIVTPFCMNSIATITSLQHPTWNFSQCTNKSSQPKGRKSASKPTDSEQVSRNFNPPIRKSRKWKYNSEKCSLNCKRKTKKSQNSLSVSPETRRMPSSNRQLSQKNKKRPPFNPIVLKIWLMRLKNNVPTLKRCWMTHSKRSSNLKKSISMKSDHSTIHLQLSSLSALDSLFYSGIGSWPMEVKSSTKNRFQDRQARRKKTSFKWPGDSWWRTCWV